MAISLCMIVRDEEEHLERCLASVAGAVDELVVVDTGSRDRTPDIARAHGARVVEHAWADHFAEARNAGIEVATGDWILVLDADEALVGEDRDALRALAGDPAVEAYTMLVRNLVAEHGPPATTSRGVRLFRNRPAYRYTGRIHESVAAALPADRIVASRVRIDHYGYAARTRAARDKSRRNLTLLERQAHEEPDSPFVQHNLGSEHAALGDHARASEHFARALELLGDDLPPYARNLHRRAITSLRLAGRHDEAIALARRATERLPGFTDVWFEWAQAARAAGDLAEAERLARHCLTLGDAGEDAGGVTGAGSFRAAAVLAGVLRERGDATGAERLLRATLAAHPHHVPLVHALAAAMLARGATPEEVDAATAGAGALPDHAVRFTLATAFREAGYPDATAAQLERVRAAAPGTDAGRLAAAELALDAGDWDEAVRAAGAVDPASDLAGQAALAAAHAHAALGDREAVLRAVADARAAGAPREEVAVPAAWADPGDVRLPHEALPPLTVAFARCLAAGEADRAVELLRLFEHVEGLAARDRRELLALLYLRHGLLDLAADEWSAATQESGPDAAALLGLARVAAARGHADDALVFAEGALELDPSSAGARALVQALTA